MKNTSRKCLCSTWDQFISQVRKITFPAATRLFRGQRDPTWKLASAFERNLDHMRDGNPSINTRELFDGDSYEKYRDSYLSCFKDLAIGLPQFKFNNLIEQEWWAIGRHHGLITSLLDWSKSPYVAAFFAFMDHAEYLNPDLRSGINDLQYCISDSQSIAIWELNVIDGMGKEFSMFTARPDNAYRQKNQRGVFTQLDHPLHLDIEAYLTSINLGHLLIKYEIPGAEMGIALNDCNLMNINSATMFPDLDGAAAMSNSVIMLNMMAFSASRRKSINEMQPQM